ncbi:MAG: hypothetical protein R3E39_17885 [Anaerolineae bacterium]
MGIGGDAYDASAGLGAGGTTTGGGIFSVTGNDAASGLALGGAVGGLFSTAGADGFSDDVVALVVEVGLLSLDGETDFSVEAASLAVEADLSVLAASVGAGTGLVSAGMGFVTDTDADEGSIFSVAGKDAASGFSGVGDTVVGFSFSAGFASATSGLIGGLSGLGWSVIKNELH